MASIRIGVSGWTYPPWRGHFYPSDLPRRDELAYAAGHFPALEINGTFYRLQRPSVFARWAAAVPDDFVFAVKGPRYITHVRRLREIEVPLANFFASGVTALGPKLGPLLWQFPPNFSFDPETFGAFLALLPRSVDEAVRLARRATIGEAPAPVAGRADQPLRHAVEIRHDSFREPAFIGLLRAHAVALVCADTVEWPRLMDVTADFVYCRLHGSEQLYRSAYGPSSLKRWAARVQAWSEGRAMIDGDFADRAEVKKHRRDVYVFFDNTDKLHAPEDAATLMRMLHVDPPHARERAA